MGVQRALFIHVMKTGGTSLRAAVEACLTPDETWPDLRGMTRDDMIQANVDVARLASLNDARRATIRFYSGHLPFYVVGLIPTPVLTMTVLRHPVERTISYLQHCKRLHPEHRELSLEEIYGDWSRQLKAINNHQTKVFALDADGFPGVTSIYPADDDRLRVACQNLASIDIVGTHERYAEFADTVASRMGLDLRIGRLRASEETYDLSDSFRRRILEDNWADLALYEEACRLEASRPG